MTDLLSIHRDLLERRRHSMNLVGPGPIDVHYRDAEEALHDLQPSGHWIDLGTGAGFPGMIFAAMYPNADIDLLDSRTKRCVFLEATLIAAGRPNHIHVLNQRFEDLPDQSYDGVLARAVAPPPVILDIARRLLRPSGRVVLFLQGEIIVPRLTDFIVERDHRYQIGPLDHRAVTLRRKT